jgi:hypothetical protein
LLPGLLLIYDTSEDAESAAACVHACLPRHWRTLVSETVGSAVA